MGEKPESPIKWTKIPDQYILKRRDGLIFTKSGEVYFEKSGDLAYLDHHAGLFGNSPKWRSLRLKLEQEKKSGELPVAASPEESSAGTKSSPSPAPPPATPAEPLKKTGGAAFEKMSQADIIAAGKEQMAVNKILQSTEFSDAAKEKMIADKVYRAEFAEASAAVNSVSSHGVPRSPSGGIESVVSGVGDVIGGASKGITDVVGGVQGAAKSVTGGMGGALASVGGIAERGVGGMIADAVSSFGTPSSPTSSSPISPSSPEEAKPECPCEKVAPEKELTIKYGLDNYLTLLKNPNAGAIDVVNKLGGSNVQRLNGLIAAASMPGSGGLPSPLSAMLPQLNSVRDKALQMGNIVSGIELECKKLTDPRQLLNMISSFNLSADLACAFGIDGLDINVGFSLLNQNGALALNGAVGAAVDVDRVMNSIGEKLGLDGVAADVLGEGGIGGIMSDVNAGLGSAFAAMDSANAVMGDMVNKATEMQNMAADLIQKVASINALAELINKADIDPCLKIGSTLNGSLVSPEFLSVVRGNAAALSSMSNR